MKYHYVSRNDAASVEFDKFTSRHEGRRFITEDEILSWFKELDFTDDGACHGIGHSTCGGACV